MAISRPWCSVDHRGWYICSWTKYDILHNPIGLEVDDLPGYIVLGWYSASLTPGLHCQCGEGEQLPSPQLWIPVYFLRIRGLWELLLQAYWQDHNIFLDAIDSSASFPGLAPIYPWHCLAPVLVLHADTRSVVKVPRSEMNPGGRSSYSILGCCKS
jgi:hypothetical protein